VAEFTVIGRAGEVSEGEMKVFKINGYAVAVANIAGTLHAFQDECTHQTCSLGEGDIEGDAVVCLCHNAEFDIRSGEPLSGPATTPIPVFEVREENGDLQVSL
jgi:nitrite reductase/ring-hydroxylating ferredoxin subunit